jgi:hypothetical protein
VELSPRGTLWTYTVQYYKPPPPARLDEPFTPYGIGLVDLPEGIRIMGMISSDDPESLRIGHEMELVIETLYHDVDGSEVLTWKFRALMRSTPTPPTVGLKPDPPVGRLQPGGSGFNPTRGGEGNTPGGQP